jgi:hypothetical protein
MQRRAAAIYFVFFLVLGVASYGFISVVEAQHPEITLDAPTYEQGDTFSVDGREYTVTEVTAEESTSGGGHGGGGTTTTSMAGTIQWTNESGIETATVENGSTVTYQDAPWLVNTPNGTDVQEFSLVEELNTTQILADDPTVADETATYQDEQWVLYAGNNSLREPLSEYLPEPNRETFQRGGQFPYQGNQTTVRTIENTSVTLAWPSVQTNTIDLAEGSNVTLNGEQHVVHFPSESGVQISPDPLAYVEDVNRQEYHTERQSGLWGITILSFFAAIVLLGAAYLPVKD